MYCSGLEHVEPHLQAFKKIRNTQLHKKGRHEYRLKLNLNESQSTLLWPQWEAVPEGKEMSTGIEHRPETCMDVVVRPASSNSSYLHVTNTTIGSVQAIT